MPHVTKAISQSMKTPAWRQVACRLVLGAQSHADLSSEPNNAPSSDATAACRLELHPDQRRRGDQGIVVMGRVDDAEYTFLPIAIKFFAARRLFSSELRILAHPDFKNSSVFPHLIKSHDVDDGILVAPNGAIVPPFIAMEGGMNLKEFHKRGTIDFVTCSQVSTATGSMSLPAHLPETSFLSCATQN
jgi:hypothetical protein